MVGDPGAGKPPLLKYLALQAVDGKLPVHVELQDFAPSGQRGLLDFIAAQWRNVTDFRRPKRSTTCGLC